MFEAFPQPPVSAETIADLRGQDVLYYRHVLKELIEIGVNIARVVDQGTKSQTEYSQSGQSAKPSKPPMSEPAIAFDRLARAIRRTVILAHKLTEPEKPPAAPQHRDRIAARKRIIREVEDTIQRTTKDEEAERLHVELCERLDAPDLDDDIAQRPVGDIIKDICRDLGIDRAIGAHPWKRRTPEDIAILAARAAATISAEIRASQAPKPPDPAPICPLPPEQQTPISTSSDPP